MVALILSEKTVNLWKLKAGIDKQLANIQLATCSHYQHLKRWLWQEKSTPSIWIQKASLSLLAGRIKYLMAVAGKVVV